MNWYVHGRTSLQAGFEQQGHICEGGSCEHLAKGDAAYGYAGEADSFGEERNLMCEPCYNAFMEQRRVEPIECNDCQQEFPRNTLFRFVPFIMDGSPGENEDSKLWICKSCQEGDRHKRRMENDEEDRRREQEWEDERNDELGFDDDEPDDLEDGMPDFDHDDVLASEAIFKTLSVENNTLYAWDRDMVGIGSRAMPYSKCIQFVYVAYKAHS